MLNTEQNPLRRPLAVGDWAIVGQGDEYAGLVGQIKEIIPLGSPEHDTGNHTDDIVVDLSLMDYSDNEKAEILAKIKELGYEADSYDDVSIDSIILAPDDLIRITPQELVEYKIPLTESLERAGYVGEMLSARHYDELHAALIERVEQNYSDYRSSLNGFGAGELIDMAAAIHAHSDAYSYMTGYRGYDESELSFYLQFDNPLEIVVDEWKERQTDLDEMSFAMDFLNEPPRRQTALEVYPLVKDKPAQAAEATAPTIEPTEPKTPKERLVDKMWDEFSRYVNKLKTLPPVKIIESAFEKVFKEDLLLTVENGDFSDEQIAALLSLDRPLETLYQDWLDSDTTYMDTLRECVDGAIDVLIKKRNAEQSKAEPAAQEAIKTQPAPVKPKPEPPKKQSILSELDATIEEVRELNAARLPQTPHKSNEKEID
jgi:hypothetical protein